MTAGVTTPAPREVWLELLETDPDALVTQSPGWLDVRCELGGYRDASRLYELPEGRRLVLPLVRRSGLGSGAVAVRSSYGEGWGMGGVVGAGGVTASDVAAVVADLASTAGLRTLVRPNPLLAEQWGTAGRGGAVVVPRLGHVLDLDGGFERVEQERFTYMVRKAVRKATRSGLTVECDTGGRLVPEFHALYDLSLRRWAGRQHEPVWLARWRGHRRDSLEKMTLLAARLGDAFRLWLARHEGRAIAALIVLQGYGNAHATRSVMDADVAGPLRAMQFLHHHAIAAACADGCRHYHLGESGRSRSLAFFKENLGATPHPYAEYRFERLPLTPVERRVRAAVKRVIGFEDAG